MIFNKYIKKIIKGVKRLLNFFLFLKKYKFMPPPPFSDKSGYETLLDVIIKQEIYRLKGDIVEIGAFLGGGTYKLSRLIAKLAPDKKVYAIDIFKPKFDKTARTKGFTMSELYQKALKNKKQYDIYKKITKNCKNIITLIGDSKKISLPCKKIAFAFIDGNHSPEYVKNNFYLIWDKLVPNGIIAFDDYGYDLPQVTETIHQLISEQNDKILKIWTVGLKTIFIQKR
jgi:SAM-dependent methyltransferase